MSISILHCYGDSLTAGFGALSQDGWIARVSRALPAVTFVNHGVCGGFFSDILLSAAETATHPAKDEALFLMGGTNDILCGRRLEALTQIAEENIRALSARLPVILGTPLWATKTSVSCGWQADWAFEKNQESLLSYADFLRKLAKERRLPLIDFQKEFPKSDADYTDGIHPNADGYALMSRIALPVLTSFLSQSPAQNQ